MSSRPDPLRQTMVLGIYGIALTMLFFVFQAPDVALSEIVVSTIGLPVMILLALRKINEQERARQDAAEDGDAMSRRARLTLFGCSAVGLAVVLVLGFAACPHSAITTVCTAGRVRDRRDRAPRHRPGHRRSTSIFAASTRSARSTSCLYRYSGSCCCCASMRGESGPSRRRPTSNDSPAPARQCARSRSC